MPAFDTLFCNLCDPRLGSWFEPRSSVGGGGRSRALFIVLLVMACLGVLLGGPSVCRAASSVAIGGDEYEAPGTSGAGWEWRDASTLVLSGYDGPNITIHGDVTLVLEGVNTATFDPESEFYEFYTGVECFGNLSIRGEGSLVASGPQVGILVSGGSLALAGCTVDARAQGTGMKDAVCAGVLVDSLRVEAGARLVASSAADLGRGSFGVYVGAARGVGAGSGAAAGNALVAASTVDATGLTAGFVAAGDIALDGVGVTVPQGGAIGDVSVAGAAGARGVVDSAGAVAPHAVIAPGDGGSGGETGGGAGGEESGGGSGTGAEKPGDVPGGGSTGGGTSAGGSAGGGTGPSSDALDNKPGGGNPGPAGGSPQLKPASANGPQNSATAPAAQSVQKQGSGMTAALLPALGEAPVRILLLIPAALVCLGFGLAKAKKAQP